MPGTRLIRSIRKRCRWYDVAVDDVDDDARDKVDTASLTMTTEMMMMMTLMFVEKKSMMMRRMMKIIIIPVLVVLVLVLALALLLLLLLLVMLLVVVVLLLLLHLPALPFEVEVNHGPRPGSRPKGQSCTRFYRVLFGCYYRFPWV